MIVCECYFRVYWDHSDKVHSLEGNNGKDQAPKHHEESLQDCSKNFDDDQNADENISDEHELPHYLCSQDVHVENIEEVDCKILQHFWQKTPDEGHRDEAGLITGKNCQVHEEDEHEDIALDSKSEHVLEVS